MPATKKKLPEITLVRAYDNQPSDPGYRVLVDRLWPRGLKKEVLQIDQWAKDLAPSTELRKWFDHQPARWDEFRKRYKAELREHAAELDQLAKLAARRRVVLVYGARDTQHNQAVVLREVLNARRAAAK